MIKKLFVLSIILFAITSCTNKGANKSNTTDNEDLTVEEEILSNEASIYMLVGTYTTGYSDGIYLFQFDTISGYSKFISSVKVDNPSYLAISPDQKYVYAISEKDDKAAAVNSFSFDKKKGALSFLNKQLTGGGAPCYVTIDKEAKHVITANYLGGNISIFDVEQNGMLAPASQVINFAGKGINPTRQEKPHLHYVNFSPDGKYLFANDLGTDKIYKFDVNEKDTGNFLTIGTPPSFKVKDGSGPRHIDFHPNGKYIYLITELSGDIVAFDYNNGNLTEIQSIKCDSLGAAGSADIHVSPDGKFLYASNRLKGDGIAIFSINQADGLLTQVGYQATGIHPRNFAITPNGKFMLVASRDGGIIQIFSIDKSTGLLENVNKDIEIDMPVCIKFASFK